MSSTGGVPIRVAVCEREPLAGRVLDALAGRGVLITGTGFPPTMALRGMPETIAIDADEWSPGGVAAIREAFGPEPPDAIWAGWGGWEHALAIARWCAEGGVRPLGPSLPVLEMLHDTERSAAMAGLGASIEAPIAVEVAFVAGVGGDVRLLAAIEVATRGPGKVVVATFADAGLGEAARSAAVRLRAALAERFGPGAAAGGITLRLTAEAALVAAVPCIPPWFAAAEVAGRFDAVASVVSGFEESETSAELVADRRSGRAAVAAVLRAEDPLSGFRPVSGEVRAVRFGAGPGIRIDPAVAVGDQVRPVDSVVPVGEEAHPDREQGAILAIVTAEGADAAEAEIRLRRAIAGTAVVIAGGPTDRTDVLALLGGTDQEGAGVAVVDAAIAVALDRERGRRDRFVRSAARGRPEVGDDDTEQIELRYGTRDHALKVFHVGAGEFVVQVAALSVPVQVRAMGPFERRLTLPDGPHEVVELRRGRVHVVEVDGALHRVTEAGGSVVVAPGPAVVVQTLVASGDEVVAGAPLVVLEAMKMEMSVAAPDGGIVRSVVGRNVQVAAGETLVRLDVDRDPPLDVPAARFDRFASATPPDATPVEGFRRVAARLRRLLLGFDPEPTGAGDLPAAWARAAAALPVDAPEVLRAEREALEAFADVAAVAATRRPSGPDADLVPAPADPFPAYLRTLDAASAHLPDGFVDDLRRALALHGVHGLDRSPELEEAVFRIARSNARTSLEAAALVAILDRWLEHAEALRGDAGTDVRDLLDRVAQAARHAHPAVADLALEVRHRWFDQPLIEQAFERQYDAVQRTLIGLVLGPDRHRARRVGALVSSPLPLRAILIPTALAAREPADGALLEALLRRYYRIRELDGVTIDHDDGRPVATTAYEHEGAAFHLLATVGTMDDLAEVAAATARRVDALPEGGEVLTEWFLVSPETTVSPDEMAERLRAALEANPPARRVHRAAVSLSGRRNDLRAPHEEHFTFRQTKAGEPFEEDLQVRGLHPMMGKRLDLWRLQAFDIERLPSVEDVYLFRAVAKENPRDERLVCLTEVRDLTPLRDEADRVTSLPHLERMFTEALAAIRLAQSRRSRRTHWNRVQLNVRPVAELGPEEMFGIVRRMAPLTDELGLEKVLIRAGIRDPVTGEVHDRIMHISNPAGRGLTLRFDEPSDRPIRPLTPYWQKVVQARQRGLVYPYELMKMLAPGDGAAGGPFPPGTFVEHDLDGSETRLVPVDRPPGENRASVVAGVVTNVSAAYPEGMTRVVLLGDPSRGLGSLAEAECRRINAALDLAEEMDVPLEWFAVSSGARISMESGTENMDWIGRVLRRLIEFTQAGGEVNVVVCGINVGAQPYWNAEATMLMHTRGVLIMTANGAMVLTGKDALDYSGGVSADDNFGIGGYDRVMGPNGQAQYWAADVAEACGILLRHYEHTYRRPGERFPRRVPTDDPFDRDVGPSPHRGEGFATVGDIFSARDNPDRKRPFDIRSVMRAVVDADHGVLERWANMRDAETVVVWDAFLGGFPVCLLGIESRPVPRSVPGDADGPGAWTSGTLFPQSSKKAARAINSASGNRPLVVLANLSGFDGSPESMRKVQLEYGAEIGRAVTNFRGPIVFLVVSRYHGGAFVVFSQTLNERLEVAAVEGSYASVIGGAPAAAVVFAREIDARVAADPAVLELEERLRTAAPEDRAWLRAQLDDLTTVIRAERLGDVAEEFDAVHDIHRALKTGSVHRIIEPARIRPYLIDALERGVAGSANEELEPDAARNAEPGPPQGDATTASTSSP